MKHLTHIFTLLLVSLLLTTAASAQNSGELRATTLTRQLNKHTYNGEYEKSERRVASQPKLLSRAKDGEPFIFSDRVWFPGEWEEVQGIVVSPLYNYRPIDHYDDAHYSAEPLVEGWGDIYYKNDPNDPNEKLQLVGKGFCEAKIDVATQDAAVYLNVMGGIQEAGVTAWVRIQNEGDDKIVIHALDSMGLRNDDIKFFKAPGNSVWFRDCGPICFYYGDDDDIAMLDFLYGGRALDDMLPSYLHRQFDIPNYITDIRWEGGNCLVDGLGGLVTSTASYENEEVDTVGRLWWDGKDYSTIEWTPRKPFTKSEVKYALSGMLGQRQTTILPRLNYDGRTGHVDLYLDATDENSLYMTQMPEDYDYWSDYDVVMGNTSILFNKKSFFKRKYYYKGAIPFPSFKGKNWASEEVYATYARSYANHLICNNHIIQPCFSDVDPETHLPIDPVELANIKILQDIYKGYTFYCVDMRTFDGSGGSIHCITKQIPAENPVRIIHKDIYGEVNPGTLESIPFSAVITNKYGIKEAKLIYRVNGSDWAEVPLTADGNCWSTALTLDSFLGEGQPLTAEGTNVEYFIEATSNNDKTITKPFNAYNGGSYGFTLTNKVEYDESMFDFITATMPMEHITFQLETTYLAEDTSSADDDPTEVVEIREHRSAEATSGRWYTIDGMPLSSHPSAKGIYLYKGKKVAIR